MQLYLLKQFIKSMRIDSLNNDYIKLSTELTVVLDRENYFHHIYFCYKETLFRLVRVDTNIIENVF